MAATTEPRHDWRHTKAAYIIVGGLWIAYVVLTFLSPQATNDRFHLNVIQTTILRLTVAIPYLLIWLTAVNGAIAFKRYANLIHGGTEAKGINRIASGILWTLAYLIILAVLGAMVPYFAKTDLGLILQSLRNNLPGIASLIGAYMLYRGSSDLKAIAKFDTWDRTTPWLFLIFALLSAVFAVSFYFSPTSSIGSAGLPVYALPPGVLLFTLILPSLATWFLGMLASINLLKYAKRVRGVIYQHAIRDLVRGIASITLFSILLQVLFMVNPLLQKLNLATLLLMIYVLLGLYAMGFLFVKSGAKKLTRIEVAA